MHLYTLLNLIGYFLGVGGAILLYYFGLPPKIDPEGHCYLIMEQIDEEEKAKANVYRKYSNVGILLITLSLLFQAASTISNEWFNGVLI